MSDLFFYHFSLEQFNLIHSMYQKLDDKINKMLSTILTIEPIFIALAYYLMKENLKFWPTILFSLSFGAFTFASILGIRNHIPKKIEITDPLKFYYKNFDQSIDKISEKAAVNIADDAQKLLKQVNDKGEMLKNMQIAIVAGIFLLFLAFLTLLLF